MKQVILFYAARKNLAIVVLSAIAAFFLTPLVGILSTPLSFQIWFAQLGHDPWSAIPYIVFSVLFGLFIQLYRYSKNNCRDCKVQSRTGFGGSVFGFMLGICPACFSFVGFIIPLGGSIFLTRYSPLFLSVSIAVILFSIYKMGGLRKTTTQNSSVDSL
ncbi:MAG: hypothetical protein ACRDFB_10915 [Rhabdochlamydiaceae bacterium]